MDKGKHWHDLERPQKDHWHTGLQYSSGKLDMSLFHNTNN